jgi:HlyD family secretion protein
MNACAKITILIQKKYNHLGKFLCLILVASIVACNNKPLTKFQGYLEGEYLYMAPSVAGHLDKLLVTRGQKINASATIFVIEQADQVAQVKQSTAQLHAAQSLLKDINLGKRKPELDAIRAQIRQAANNKNLAAITLTRDKKQFHAGAIARAQLDTSIANYKVAADRLTELKNDLKTAELPGRTNQIKAQAAQVKYAHATLHDSNWRLSQTITTAPKNSLVYDTLYNEGEWVAAGSPVVVLLPPGKLKVRFFAPEKTIGKLKLGQKLTISCNGCVKPIDARITYISNQAEYTPPVIYSNETRDKLVFRIEAKPIFPDVISMHPGQPVEVTINER